jgi:hypothetical protein
MLQDIGQLMNVKIRKEEVNYKDKNAADMHDVDCEITYWLCVLVLLQ